MLNYNKIESAINYERVPRTKIANILGIGESTLRSRLERKNLTPDDVEKLADYFNKSILYFFDREEPETHPVVNEVRQEYKITRVDCPECISKLRTIAELEEYRRKYIECLEELAGKKKAAS